MNAISKLLLLCSLVVLFSGMIGAVQALTMSGEANGTTCSQLAAECVNFNRAGGFNMSRCAGYKASCIATGTYSDRKRTVTGAVKK